MRKHGFSKPLSFFQILTWGVFFVLICSFYFFYLPVSPINQICYVSIPYSFIMLATLFFGYKATICNPCDSHLTTSIRVNHKSTKRCTVCKASVLMSSKHCSICDKCISGFDHHCKALNNCIGSKNYSSFFKLIISLEGLLLIQFSSGIYILFYHTITTNNIGLIVFLVIELFIVLVLIVLNTLLIFFHIWLKFKKISTYEYVISKRTNTALVSPSIDIKKSNAESYIINSPSNRDLSPISITKDLSYDKN